MRSSPVSIGPARSIRARITSDFGILPRRAQRARRAARFLSSLTVMVGMVIPRYYHVCRAGLWFGVPGPERDSGGRCDSGARIIAAARVADGALRSIAAIVGMRMTAGIDKHARLVRRSGVAEIIVFSCDLSTNTSVDARAEA